MRIQGLPDQRQGQLEHLGDAPERRVVLESRPWQADALERVVENDAVAVGHDDGAAAVRERAHDLRRRLRRNVPRERADDDQRAVCPQFLHVAVEKQCLQLAEIRSGRCPGGLVGDRSAVEVPDEPAPHQRQVVDVVQQLYLVQLHALRFEPFQDRPQTLSDASGDERGGKRLHRRHVVEPLARSGRKPPVPALQVPLVSPVA